MRLSHGFVVVLVLFLRSTPAAWAQVALEEVPGIPQPRPYIVAPGQFPEPVVVPAAVVLQQADALQPLTAEGWIVMDRPVTGYSATLDPVATMQQDFDYQMRRRQYDTQIRIARAEIDALTQREIVYRYFNKTGALMVDYQNVQLARLAAEERLSNIRYERMLYMRLQNRLLFPQETILSRKILPSP